VQAAIESALRDLALGPELDLGDAAAVHAWFDRHQISAEDGEAILAAGIERLAVYRQLVRGNLRDAVEIAIPRVVARLGSVFDEWFDRFLAERGPRTHYLRDVTRELLDFCEPQWAADPRVPPYMLDLARHENVQIEVGALQSRPLAQEPGELALDRPVRFVEAARVMRYGFAVHRLSESLDDRTEPERTPTALFVYRNPEHEVRYLELTPMAAALLDRLLRGEALGRAIEAAGSELGGAIDPALIEGSARLLSDLAERGALLGAA
jgi:hypothetical protein